MKTTSIKLAFLFLLQAVVTALYAQTAPSNFQATPSTSAYQILLTWTNSTDSEENGFAIQKEWDDGYLWNSIEIVIPPNTTSFTDTSVDPNVTYYYSNGDITITTTLFRQAPPVPANVTAVAGPFMTIEASFTDNSDMETWYEVQHTSYLPEFSGDPENFFGKEVITGGVTGSVHTVSLVQRGPYSSWNYYAPNSTVYVRVRAVIKDGTKFIFSKFSPLISTITNPLPEKPSDFIATSADDAIHLSWTDNANHEAGFLLARSTGDFDYSTDIIRLPFNTTSYIDSGITPNVQYTYKLVAIDMEEYTSDHSEWDWLYLITSVSRNVVTTGLWFRLPPAPTGLHAESISTTAIDLTFSDASNLASYYDVEMASSSDGPYSPLQDYDGWLFAEANYLEPNTTYYFKVRGILEIGNNSTYYGPFSNVVFASTLPDTISAPLTPLAKLATFVTPTSFTANWTAVENADHYELDVITINDSTFFHDYESKVVYDTSLAVTGTRASKRYKYMVRAVNDHGESVNSNSIRVATIKDLTLRTVCSDNPQVNRRWKIINNNPFPVDVNWHIPNTSQTGTLAAAPGESFFTTQTIPGIINYTIITWYDDYLNQHSSLKSATYKSCMETMARGATINDDVEEETFFEVQAYPNPFEDKFSITISTPDDTDADVEIINLQGQRIANAKVAGNTELQVDGTTYPSGLYIIRVLQKNNVGLYKMFKK